MFAKVAVIGAVLAVCNAGLLVDNGHGQAVSSQSIIRHDQPGHIAQYAPVLQHSAPQLQHAEPILQKSIPLVQHTYSDNSLYHSGPIVQQYAPTLHQAPVVQHITPVAAAKFAVSPAAYAHDEHYDAPAKYEFSYSVEDPHTGDHKSQHEARDGDIVKGDYSLLQPDGSIRKVEYTADAHSGFNAVVHNSAPTLHAQDAHASVLHAEPIYEHHH